MRVDRLLAVVIGVTALLAWTGVARADSQDQPVASCAGGFYRPGALRQTIARAAR
jgi:hypothetical protein